MPKKRGGTEGSGTSIGVAHESGRELVFVFGSNLAGRHGAGSALQAVKEFGAVYGCGFGRQGNSYAIPTKDAGLNTLPLERIQSYVRSFLVYACAHRNITFKVVAIGTGLAGYKHAQIAPMFKDAPKNCELIMEWDKILKRGQFKGKR